MFTTKEELLDYLKKENVEYVDIRFCDLPGVVQHFSIPASAFDESVFEEGLAFDGSSVRGFQSINESDMMLLPDPATARIDPFRKAKTMNLSFFVHDPFTREAYSRDPRNVARKAEDYLASTGIADTCFFGAEAEFYIFDSVSFGSEMNGTFYEVESESGWWNTASPTDPDGSPNLGYKVRPKGGYFPVAPYDHYVDLRDEMSTNLQNSGFELERGHHEVGTAGQAEINYKFNTLLHAADDVQLFKYIIKNTAWQNGKSVTFMPKPLFGDNGSGMHTHQSLWKDGEPLFYDEQGYGGLSDIARWYIGGILEHAGMSLDIRTRRVEVDVASHHPTIDPVLPELREALAYLTPAAPKIPLVSTVAYTGSSPMYTADYWAANLRNPVRFSQAVTAAATGHSTFIEVSPHPILTYAIDDTLADVHHHSVATLLRNQDDALTFHTNLNAAQTTTPFSSRPRWDNRTPRAPSPAHTPSGYPR